MTPKHVLVLRTKSYPAKMGSPQYDSLQGCWGIKRKMTENASACAVSVDVSLALLLEAHAMGRNGQCRGNASKYMREAAILEQV